ncbi:hypothetical protein QF001_001713 [Paraburkholderia youngii]
MPPRLYQLSSTTTDAEWTQSVQLTRVPLNRRCTVRCMCGKHSPSQLRSGGATPGSESLFESNLEECDRLSPQRREREISCARGAGGRPVDQINIQSVEPRRETSLPWIDEALCHCRQRSPARRSRRCARSWHRPFRWRDAARARHPARDGAIQSDSGRRRSGAYCAGAARRAQSRHFAGGPFRTGFSTRATRRRRPRVRSEETSQKTPVASTA